MRMPLEVSAVTAVHTAGARPVLPLVAAVTAAKQQQMMLYVDAAVWVLYEVATHCTAGYRWCQAGLTVGCISHSPLRKVRCTVQVVEVKMRCETVAAASIVIRASSSPSSLSL